MSAALFEEKRTGPSIAVIAALAVFMIPWVALQVADPEPSSLAFIGGCALIGWWRHRNPVLRIGPGFIEHSPLHSSPRHRWLGLFFLDGWLDRLEAHEVERLEWDGHDNIGIRLRDGDVVSVSFLEVAEHRRPAARAAILDFVERSALSPGRGRC